MAYLSERLLGRLRTEAEARRAAVPPAAAEEAAALRRAGRLADGWRAVGVVSEPPPQGMYGRPISLDHRPDALSENGWRALHEDLQHLCAATLARELPRDVKGQLVLGETVLLERYDASVPSSRGKAMWLVARTPLRRSEPQVVRLLVDVIAGDHFAHRWETARWRWDARAADAGADARWGVTGLPLPMLDAEDRPRRIDELRRACARPGAGEGVRAGLAILLLDEGRFAEAMECLGVALGREVVEALAGAPVAAIRAFILEGHPNLAEAYLRPQAERDAGARGDEWRQRLEQELWEAAPWRFAAALAAGGGRPRRQARPSLRLFNLAWSNSARRPALFLTSDEHGPCLRIAFSGTSSILPHTAWKRPRDLDLVRFGLAATWPPLAR